uniref:Phospholipase/carboxylesterase/thioesterase domain-containing protein n=1 Tax=Eutreptiella gymnastica TaxID=73025 RepID=A0A7S1NCY2_9EUGL|mmetsp:Transcript_17340/g.30941  ORF Transcript_17340/g.30941 Transcript_17340/m.30941 type:complete len:319 (+) Transcript_17340:64-1020(+)
MLSQWRGKCRPVPCDDTMWSLTRCLSQPCLLTVILGLTLFGLGSFAFTQPNTSDTPVGELQPILGRYNIRYELFLPKAWKAGTSKWPVLVFLHGRGESGSFDVTNAQSLPLQLLNNRTFIEQCPFIVLVPQCPRSCAEHGKWKSTVLQQVTKTVEDVIHEYNGDPQRIYLAGQSMGGHGAWMYSAMTENLFAAVVVICGYVQQAEVQTVVAQLSARPTPVVIVHAADDSVIPVDASDLMYNALRSAGHPHVRYLRYESAPGPPIAEYAFMTGHASYELAFRDPGLFTHLLSHMCTSCSPLRAKSMPGRRSPARVPDAS